MYIFSDCTSAPTQVEMETSLGQCEQTESEEYVILDLESVCLPADIPANTPYTLSGLDTLNPILSIGDRLKLVKKEPVNLQASVETIGEYEETIGTCFLFSQEDAEMVASQWHKNGPNEAPVTQVRHAATASKVLKFRLEADP